MDQVKDKRVTQSSGSITGQADRIRQLRMRKSVQLGRKVTQEEVRAYVGVSRTSISMWETEDIQMEYQHLERLAQFYEVPISYIREGSADFLEPTPDAEKPHKATSLASRVTAADEVALNIYQLDSEADTAAFIEGRPTAKTMRIPFSVLTKIADNLGLEALSETHDVLWQRDLQWIATRTDRVVRSDMYALAFNGRVHICQVQLHLGNESATVTDICNPDAPLTMRLDDESLQVVAAVRGLSKKVSLNPKAVSEAVNQ